jgi:hypothetical protein
MRSYNALTEQEKDNKIEELTEALGEYEVIQDDINDLIGYQIQILETVNLLADENRKLFSTKESYLISQIAPLEILKARILKFSESNDSVLSKDELILELERKFEAFKEFEYEDLAGLHDYSRLAKKLAILKANV